MKVNKTSACAPKLAKHSELLGKPMSSYYTKATKYYILNPITSEIKKIKDSRHCKVLLTISYNMFQGNSVHKPAHALLVHHSLKLLCVA